MRKTISKKPRKRIKCRNGGGSAPASASAPAFNEMDEEEDEEQIEKKKQKTKRRREEEEEIEKKKQRTRRRRQLWMSFVINPLLMGAISLAGSLVHSHRDDIMRYSYGSGQRVLDIVRPSNNIHFGKIPLEQFTTIHDNFHKELDKGSYYNDLQTYANYQLDPATVELLTDNEYIIDEGPSVSDELYMDAKNVTDLDERNAMFTKYGYAPLANMFSYKTGKDRFGRDIIDDVQIIENDLLKLKDQLKHMYEGQTTQEYQDVRMQASRIYKKRFQRALSTLNISNAKRISEDLFKIETVDVHTMKTILDKAKKYFREQAKIYHSDKQAQNNKTKIEQMKDQQKYQRLQAALETIKTVFSKNEISRANMKAAENRSYAGL